MTADVLVVGTGLVGTSVGLALRADRDVVVADVDADVRSRACRLGAGRPWDGRERAALVLVCTPPRTVATELLRLHADGAAETYSHVSSVQAAVQREVEASLADASAVCGGHPMAGRERSGPEAAAADLFVGRPWAVCPGAGSSERARRDVAGLASAVGATPVQLDPVEHDRLVALVSHVPQLAASAVAALLGDGTADPLPLAGPGLQDVTRLAASDPALWQEVLLLNAGNVAPLVRRLSADLGRAADALEGLAADAPEGPGLELVLDLLRRGRGGRHRVPVKRGDVDAAFAQVAVSVPDAPGRLAALLTAAGDGGVNVEDVRVEHAPGRPFGVLELTVRTAAEAQARAVLLAAGWDVLDGR